MFNLVDIAKDFVVKNGPGLLLGIGIGGFFITSYECAKKTVEATKKIEEIKENTPVEEIGTDEYKKEVAKKVIPMYIPTMAGFALSAACVITSFKITNDRHASEMAAIATAYSASKNELKSYKDKVKEALGAEKEEEIQKKVDEDTLKSNPQNEKNTLNSNVNGDCRCYDPVTGNYFWSDAHKIRIAIDRVNERLRSEMYVPLNELYYELGLDPCEAGDQLGFNINDGYIHFSPTTRLDKYDRPCLVLRFHISPRYNFADNH